MDRSFSALLFLSLFMAATSAVTLPQDYWKKVLPNTPMPGAVRDLLPPPEGLDEKASAADNKGVVVLVPPYPYSYWHPYWKPYYGGPFLYRYAATDTQLRDHRDVAVFFLEKHLHAGAKMKLHFPSTATSAAPFMPREAADALPFSSAKLPETLNRFSIKPSSSEAEAMRKTLQACEDPAAAGETRRCATSLESMVDFATSALGTRHVQAVSTEVVGKGSGAAAEQYYTVEPAGVKRLVGDQGKAVACHAQPYPYAVFYCHAGRGTRVYAVPLVGEDGRGVAAVAACHTDTSAWNPGHLAFRVLKVKPGTVPICHFLPQDHIVWARQEHTQMAAP